MIRSTNLHLPKLGAQETACHENYGLTPYIKRDVASTRSLDLPYAALFQGDGTHRGEEAHCRPSVVDSQGRCLEKDKRPQTRGRIPKVEPPNLDSKTPMVGSAFFGSARWSGEV